MPVTINPVPRAAPTHALVGAVVKALYDTPAINTVLGERIRSGTMEADDKPPDIVVTLVSALPDNDYDRTGVDALLQITGRDTGGGGKIVGIWPAVLTRLLDSDVTATGWTIWDTEDAGQGERTDVDDSGRILRYLMLDLRIRATRTA